MSLAKISFGQDNFSDMQVTVSTKSLKNHFSTTTRHQYGRSIQSIAFKIHGLEILTIDDFNALSQAFEAFFKRNQKVAIKVTVTAVALCDSQSVETTVSRFMQHIIELNHHKCIAGSSIAEILQRLEAIDNFQPQADASDAWLEHDCDMQVCREHCTKSLFSQDWESGSTLTMTRPMHTATSDRAVELEYLVEVYQEYCNESLPDQDWDFDMSDTAGSPTSAASSQKNEEHFSAATSAFTSLVWVRITCVNLSLSSSMFQSAIWLSEV